MSAKKPDPSNPFAALNAALFPAEPKKKAPAAKTRPAKSKMPPAQPDDDPDAQLFLQAVSSSMRLPAKDADNKKAFVKKAGKKTSMRPDGAPGATMNIEADAAKVDGDEALAQAFRQHYGKSKNTPGTKSITPITGHANTSKHGANVAEASPKKQGDAEFFATKQEQLDALGLPNPDLESQDFFQAIKDVTPLSGKGREVPPEPQPIVVPQVAASNPLQDLIDGKIEFSLSGTDEFVEGHVVGLDLLTVGRLQARHYSPEAHIDLHGLNSEQAYHNLVGFFRSAYHKGVRTTLVVTGRGLNSPNGTPVLRGKVQEWFTKEPFRRVVLAFCTAKQEDGGTGALYVLLRKYRKNAGKIRWDAVPTDADFFL